jgi:hypothetical protein
MSSLAGLAKRGFEGHKAPALLAGLAKQMPQLT